MVKVVDNDLPEIAQGVQGIPREISRTGPQAVITRLEAHDYRCFPALVVDLDRYHVLAGANGAGKTTLLDIPVLIGDMLRQQGSSAAFLERAGDGAAPGPPRSPTAAQGNARAIAFAFEARLPPDVREVLG